MKIPAPAFQAPRKWSGFFQDTLPGRTAALAAGLVLAGCNLPPPPYVSPRDQQAMAFCEYQAARAANADMRELVVRRQCLDYYRLTGLLPGEQHPPQAMMQPAPVAQAGAKSSPAAAVDATSRAAR